MTENADSPNTASIASGDSTCGRQDAVLLRVHMTEGHRLKSRIDSGFIVFLKLIKLMTSQFWMKVLCAVCLFGRLSVHQPEKKNKTNKNNPLERWNPSAIRRRRRRRTLKVSVSRSTRSRPSDTRLIQNHLKPVSHRVIPTST